MFIKYTYKFEKDGIIGYACNTNIVPEGTIISKIRVLNSEKGMVLKNIKTEEKNYVVPLLDGDTIENYIEIEEQND